MSTRPEALRPGETVAFVSPSARVNDLWAPAFARGRAAVEAAGHPVRVFWTAEPGGEGAPTIAEHAETRKRELLAAFADPEVRAVVCTVGGETANELVLALLRDPAALAALRARPKVFVGYSDITALHWLLHRHCGLRTFYGPGVVPELGEAPAPLPFTLDNLLRAVRHDGAAGGPPPPPLGPVPRSPRYAPGMPAYVLGGAPDAAEARALAPSPPWRWVRPGACEGRIFGGCLTLVNRLQAYPALRPDWAGRVVLLETSMGDRDEGGLPLGRIRQSLVDMVGSGVLGEAAGVVLGRFWGYDDAARHEALARTLAQALAPEVVGRELPVLMDVDVGHTSPMVTIPLDARVRLDSERDLFEILEAGVV